MFLFIKDCTACYNDIMSAIEDCNDSGDIIKCVEDILLASADCVVSFLAFAMLKISFQGQ